MSLGNLLRNILFAVIPFLAIKRADALPVSAASIILKSENSIDFKVTGTTLIISGLPNDFVPINISFYGNNISGIIGWPTAPHFSIGWTSPNYQDMISRLNVSLQLTGTSTCHNIGNTANSALGTAPVIPAGTNIYLNVTIPDSAATTNIQQIYITGYYLF